MRALLPERVAVVELRRDVLVPLFPEEEAAVATAVPARRREFMTTRECARRALMELGWPVVAIARGKKGKPEWPQGIVGSLTHCHSYRAAALTDDPCVASLGIDAEPNEALPPGLLKHIASKAERLHLEQMESGHPGPRYDRLLFSAKEAVYKAWFPVEHAWLDFEDVEIKLNPKGTFSVSLNPALQSRHFYSQELVGRWSLREGNLLTAVQVSEV